MNCQKIALFYKYRIYFGVQYSFKQDYKNVLSYCITFLVANSISDQRFLFMIIQTQDYVKA